MGEVLGQALVIGLQSEAPIKSSTNRSPLGKSNGKGVMSMEFGHLVTSSIVFLNPLYQHKCSLCEKTHTTRIIAARLF